MFELIEKAVLTGLGFVSLSQKKADELLEELKGKYKVSEEDGKAFLERIQKTAQETRTRIAEIAETEVKKVIEKLGLVSRDEFNQLVKRIEKLENPPQGVDPADQC